MLLWGKDTHRTTNFLLGDTGISVLICPDLIKSCSAGKNPGQTSVWPPWHAVMGMATGLEFRMLLSHQQTHITIGTGDMSLLMPHSDSTYATQERGVLWVMSGDKDEVHSE